MNDTTTTNNCERAAAELVPYFYGEASRDERASFDAHLARCGACRDELAAFDGVRAAVGHWRTEILNNAPAPSHTGTVAPEAQRETVNAVNAAVLPRRETASVAAVPRRDALAALRAFFTLSPPWLRAGTFAAASVVCALVALAVVNAEVRLNDSGLAFSTRLRSDAQTATPTPVSAPAGKVYSQAELDKLAAERDAALRELEDTRAQLNDSREANLIAAVETFEPASKTNSTTDNPRRERRASPAPATPPKPRRDERDEEDVPRLYDLLSEAN